MRFWYVCDRFRTNFVTISRSACASLFIFLVFLSALLLLFRWPMKYPDYPKVNSPRLLFSLREEAWRKAEVTTKLSDCHWHSVGDSLTLEGVFTVINNSPYKAYYLKTDLESPYDLEVPLDIESLDEMDSVQPIFYRTINPDDQPVPSSSLVYIKPGGKVIHGLKWRCTNIVSDHFGKCFRLDDCYVRSGATVRIRVVANSLISLVGVSNPDGNYVDMWKIAEDPQNAFIEDLFSDWVEISMPEL